MNHIYEVFVDIKEYGEQFNSLARVLGVRYEIDAESKLKAHDFALVQAEHEYPRATEFDVRVTRLLS